MIHVITSHQTDKVNRIKIFPSNRTELFQFFRMLFVFGIILFLLGVVIDFVPGSEEDWFIVCALFLAFGMFSFSKIQMTAASLLVAFAIYQITRNAALSQNHRKLL